MKKKNSTSPEFTNEIMILDGIFTQEMPDWNYMSDEKKFCREFGGIMKDKEINPYLDFLTGRVSLS